MALLRQTWTMTAVFSNVLSYGLVMKKFTSETEDPKAITRDWEFTFLVIGSLISSILMDKIGRRLTYTVAISLGLIFRLLIILGYIDMVYARSLNAISFGSTNILDIMIIGEYTSPKYRGIFLNFTVTALNIGHILQFFLIKYYKWNTILNAALMLQLLSLGITLSWPESPYWLAMKRRYAESFNNFIWLHQDSKTCEIELNDLISQTEKTKIKTTTLLENFSRILKNCTNGNFLKPFTIVIFGSILTESAGKHYLTDFASQILSTISGSDNSQDIYLLSIITTSSIISLALLALFTHRIVLLSTGVISLTLLLFTSIFSFMVYNNYDRSWIGTLLLMSHITFANLGCTSIPSTLVGEVFPLEYRAVGCFVATVVTSFTSSATISITKCLLATVYVHGTFAIFSTAMTLALLFLFVSLPETKGRSLLEIESFFKSGWYAEEHIDDEEIWLTNTDATKIEG